jgi:2-phospho-L-lactate/phosphoenolpyruvate guanylyltransferase
MKSPRDAKSRLAPVLGPDERAALVVHMLRDVLDALGACDPLAGIALVTPDAEVAALAERHGALVVEEGPGQAAGPNAAVREGRRVLLERAAAAMIVIPGDVTRARCSSR